MKILIEEDIKTLMGDKCVYQKGDTFYVGEFNYFTIMKILKVKNENLYNELLFNKELTRAAINSILFENKDISPLDILKYIESLTSIQLFNIGNEYKNYIHEFLKTNSFQMNKFKGLIYYDQNLDAKYIFKEFPNLKVLFIYNHEKEELEIVNQNGLVIKKKKINESDLICEFDNFKENKIKDLTKSYWNKLIRDIISKLFNLKEFLKDFEEEILNRLLSILNIVDLEEETLKKLEELEQENSFPERFSKALTKKIKKENNKLEKNYGTRIL